METREIRDKLLEKRAMYQQSLKAAEEAKANFRDLIESITEEQAVKGKALEDYVYDAVVRGEVSYTSLSLLME